MAGELPIAECRLDLAGLREQRERYRRLGLEVESASRSSERLEITFGPRIDEALLLETLKVERQCCDFFKLDYSSADRRLVVGVSAAAQDPALDALAHALGVEDAA